MQGAVGQRGDVQLVLLRALGEGRRGRRERKGRGGKGKGLSGGRLADGHGKPRRQENKRPQNVEPLTTQGSCLLPDFCSPRHRPPPLPATPPHPVSLPVAETRAAPAYHVPKQVRRVTRDGGGERAEPLARHAAAVHARLAHERDFERLPPHRMALARKHAHAVLEAPGDSGKERQGSREGKGRGDG